ncbi:MAG: outer membrane protein assembly factor BamD [Verrucomicrobia bacterium]|nr:outer membrane protein assembly factor BamD [Verrucomicrobiota bacterium]
MSLKSPIASNISPKLLGLIFFSLGLCVYGAEDETAVKLYQRGMKLIAEGDVEEALDRFNTVANKYRRSETCASALWEIYRIQEFQSDNEAAFEALNRLTTEQPGHFAKAHLAQFQLTKRLLGAGKNERRTLEVQRRSETTPPEVLVAMLQNVIKNGPQTEEGIQAHYYLALAQEKAGDKKEAISTHEDFAENYPKHELADDASYQVAYIAYKEWNAMRGDSPHQREATATALSWFLARYPESDKAAAARSCLVEVRTAEQRELMSLANFYEQRGDAKAAQVYYQQMALKFPQLMDQEGELKEKILKALADTTQTERVGPIR